MDCRLELVIVPVSDVDRAKTFYTEQCRFNADHDQRVSDTLRFVQLTPRGSACSPGSMHALQVVVDDIEVAHADLAGHGVEVSDIEDLAWGRFVYFKDPDGNGWSVQQSPPRA